jgi:DNA-binding NtrC family response regulator
MLTTTSAADALRILGEEEVQVVVIDERMPQMRGSELVDLIRQRFPRIVSIMLTGNPSVELLQSLVNDQSVIRFLTKPYRPEQLRRAIVEAIDQYSVSTLCNRVIEGLEQRSGELRRLERNYPGISHVRRARDGAVVLDGEGREDIDGLIKVLEVEADAGKKGLV